MRFSIESHTGAAVGLLAGRLSAPSIARQSFQPSHQCLIHQFLPLRNWHIPPSLTEEPGAKFLSARRVKFLALGFIVTVTFTGQIYNCWSTMISNTMVDPDLSPLDPFFIVHNLIFCFCFVVKTLDMQICIWSKPFVVLV